VVKSGAVLMNDDAEIVGAVEFLRPASHRDAGTSPCSAAVDGEEVSRIVAALKAARYRRGAAAEALGVSRTTLWRRMRDYGL